MATNNKLAIILLNYRTAKETIKQVDKIKKLKYGGEIGIIIIDNCSGDGSFGLFEEHFANEKYITLLRSNANGGYAKGNNIGICYAINHGYDYSMIINPDMEFPDTLVIKRMMEVFKKRDNVAAVSPIIKAKDGYEYNPDIYRPTFFDLSIGMNAYKKKGRRISDTDKKNGYAYSYRPQGCMMILDNHKLLAVNLLDEHTFLYYEEYILAERLLRKGYRCAVALDTYAVHCHENDGSRKRDILDIIRYHRLYGESYWYYLKKYRKFGTLKRIICQVFLQGKLVVLKR